MDQISLTVNGKSYEGWKAIQVGRSMDQIAGAFGFQASDKYPGNFEKWNIPMGSECQVVVGSKTLITGFVDDISIYYDEMEHTFEVKGRDKTADLVDCCYDSAKNQWNGASIQTIVTDLCNNVGVPITIDSTVANVISNSIVTFKINEGDSIFESISKLLKTKALLPITHGDGKLTITRAGTELVNDSLESGKNIKTGSFKSSNMERYSVYIVKSQNSGLDEWDEKTINQPVARFNDYVIARTRPLVILSSEKSTTAQCRERAEWEARYRAGKSRTLQYKVQGWLQSNGDIWPLNKCILVRDTFLNVSDTYLIASVLHTLDDTSGTITEFELVPPDAYKVLEEAIKVKKSDLADDEWWLEEE